VISPWYKPSSPGVVPASHGARRRVTLLLLLIAAGAFAVRVWLSAPFSPAASLGDPDGYLEYARLIADGSGTWRWTGAAVEYAEFTKAPLYQVLMSGFTSFPGIFPMPRTALLLHAALSTLTVLLLYVTGRELHSTRAGVLSAIAYACWVPNILLTTTVWQEHLYVPLLVGGFAQLGRAVRLEAPSQWVLAGAIFGVAALARSSIAYFLLPAAIFWVCVTPGRARSAAQAALLIVSFAAVTLPYSLHISSSARQAIFIENIGYFTLKRSPVNASGLRIESFMEDTRRAPSTGEVMRYFASDVAHDPAGFVLLRLELFRMLLKPMGPMLLPSTTAETRVAAGWLKAVVHGLVDLPFVICVTLAPLGAVLCRVRRFGGLLLLWVALLLSMLALTSWAGVRFRAPAEPAMIVLAAVVLSGGWRRPRRAVLAGAIAVSALAGTLSMMNVKAVIQARANYGVDDWAPHMTEADFTGSAGLHVIVGKPRLSLLLARTERTPGGPVDVEVRFDGRLADRFRITEPHPQEVVYPMTQFGVVYLEVAATVEGRPAGLRLRVHAAE